MQSYNGINQLFFHFSNGGIISIYRGPGDITNHALFIVQDLSNTNAPQAGFELRSLGLQAGMLPIEPPLLSSICLPLTSKDYSRYDRMHSATNFYLFLHQQQMQFNKGNFTEIIDLNINKIFHIKYDV